MIKFLIKIKAYMMRSMSYMALANSAMLIFLLFSSSGFTIDLRVWGAPIIVAIVCLMTLGGYVEDKLGFWREELEITFSRNPHIQDMRKEIKFMRADLEEIKELMKK